MTGVMVQPIVVSGGHIEVNGGKLFSTLATTRTSSSAASPRIGAEERR
jgi:hypothetical protein